MSTAEIKDEINRVINTMPDTTLEAVLSYLKNVAETDLQNVKRANNLKRILEEDDNLLRRLAQ